MTSLTVGRAHELAEITAFADGISKGRSGALVIAGEAGIGKTHLLGRIEEAAVASGIDVWRASAREIERDLPFAAILEVLGPEARKHVAKLIPQDGEVGPELRFRLIEAVIDRIEEKLAGNPVLLVLDDMHFADPTSLMVIDRLQRSLGMVSLGLVLGTRLHPRTRELQTIIDDARVAGRLMMLEAMPREDVLRLAEKTLGLPAGPRLARVLEATGGNPLFVIEVLSAFDSALVEAEGSMDIVEQEAPISLYDTIGRTLSFLPDDTLTLLRAGAILGTRFDLDDLAATTGRTTLEALASLEPATRSGLLHLSGSELRFRHDLVRDTLYESVPESARRGMHREAARTLARVGRPPSSIAPHLLVSASPGDEDAFGWLRRAAADAAPQAPDVAIELLTRAVEVGGPRHAERFEVETELAQALLWSGRAAEAERLTRRLLADKHRTHSNGQARAVLLDALHLQGKLRDSLPEIEELVSQTTASDHQARILARAAAALVASAPERATALAEEVLRMDRSTRDDAARSVALTALSRIANNQADLRAAIDGLEEASAVVLGGAGPGAAIEAIAVLGSMWSRLEGRTQEALYLLSEGLRLVEQGGHVWGSWLMHGSLGIALYEAGRLDDAASALETSRRVAGEDESRVLLPLILAYLAHIEALRDDLVAADRYLSIAEQQAHRQSDPNATSDFDLLWARALVDELAGNDRSALELFERLRSEAVASCSPQLLAGLAPYGLAEIRIAIRLGETDLARAVLATVEEGVGMLRQSFAIEPWASAQLKLCTGMIEHDVDALVSACETLRSIERPMWLAPACEIAGRASASGNRREQAVALLEEARDVWAEVGASRKVREVAALLRELGVRGAYKSDPQRPRRGWDALTQTESLVAQLIAEGLTYRAIADRMFVSKRTVETHVAHIFEKLGVSSRAELTAAAPRQRSVEGH